jgi:iron complex outermembrane receptor protein
MCATASAGKLTFYLSYSDKTEPNEDGTTRYFPSRAGKPTDAYQPYTRPFFYPDFHAALDYLDAAGNYPAARARTIATTSAPPSAPTI